MSRKLIKIASLLIITLFCLSLPTAWADGVEVSVVKGNTVIPVQNDNIRMLSEEVRMFSNEKKDDIVRVNANFIFENQSGSKVMMKMGFPFFGDHPGGFRVSVQGKPQKVEKRPMGGKGEIVLQHERSGYILHMYVWDMSFPPHGKQEVKVEYDGGWGSTLTSESFFIYVTETGSLWSGTIGKADFYFKLSESDMNTIHNQKLKLRAAPGGYVLKDDQLEWHFRDWKPKGNIAVVISAPNEKSSVDMNNLSEGIIVTKRNDQPPMPDAMYRCAGYFKNKQRYEGNQKYYKTEKLERWYEDRFSDKDTMPQLCTKALRNEIYARHGRIFSTPDMKQIFESAPWYKPRKDFKESDLNEIEKKNIEFILEYEKKMGWK
jgi:hypothetical protein